jgi:hypothetical protein
VAGLLPQIVSVVLVTRRVVDAETQLRPVLGHCRHGVHRANACMTFSTAIRRIRAAAETGEFPEHLEWNAALREAFDVVAVTRLHRALTRPTGRDLDAEAWRAVMEPHSRTHSIYVSLVMGNG